MNGKGRVLAIALSHTRDQMRFTISEVADDWHELMTLRHIMRLSIARASEQLGPGAAHRHTTAPISHTRPSPRSSYATTHFPSREG